MNEHRSPRFYFALPRLLAKLRGSDPSRAEKNAMEAWAGNLAVYGISYLYFAHLIPETGSGWTHGLILIALVFLVGLFWLLVLYVNSLILNSLRDFGLFRSLPQRRGQAVLIGTTATAMAGALVQYDSFVHEIGAIWLIATGLNLAAALILALGNGKPARQ
jgi:hypothetical protein